MSATSDRHILFRKQAGHEQAIHALRDRIAGLDPAALDDRSRLEESIRLLRIKLDAVNFSIAQDQKHGRYK